MIFVILAPTAHLRHRFHNQLLLHLIRLAQALLVGPHGGVQVMLHSGFGMNQLGLKGHRQKGLKKLTTPLATPPALLRTPPAKFLTTLPPPSPLAPAVI